MKLNILIKDLRFDKRIMEWGIRYNLITYQEHQQYLNALPDLSDKKESIIDLKQIEQSENQRNG